MRRLTILRRNVLQSFSSFATFIDESMLALCMLMSKSAGGVAVAAESDGRRIACTSRTADRCAAMRGGTSTKCDMTVRIMYFTSFTSFIALSSNVYSGSARFATIDRCPR